MWCYISITIKFGIYDDNLLLLFINCYRTIYSKENQDKVTNTYYYYYYYYKPKMEAFLHYFGRWDPRTPQGLRLLRVGDGD